MVWSTLYVYLWFVYEYLRLALFSPRTQFHCRQSWICFKLNKITKRSWQRLEMEILPTKDTQKQGEDFKESKSVDPPPYEESNISLWVESLYELKKQAYLSNLVPIYELFLLSHEKNRFYLYFLFCVELIDSNTYENFSLNGQHYLTQYFLHSE